MTDIKTTILTLAELTAARQIEDETNAQTLADLNVNFKTAKRVYGQANIDADYEQTEEVIAASAALKKAGDAIEDFNKKLVVLSLERADFDRVNTAKFDLIEKLGLTPDRLQELIDASKDVNDTLKTSFTAVFGKLTIFAKQGETGKQVVANASKSEKSPDEKANGQKSEKGAKGEQVLADILSGMTHEQLLAKYPTERPDGTIDGKVLNGTVRSILWKQGMKKQADGTYAKK